MKTNKNILRRSKANGIELIQQYHEDCISTLEVINIYKKSREERLKDIQRMQSSGLPYEHYFNSYKHCKAAINRLYKRLEWQQSYIANYYHELRIENRLESVGLDEIQVNKNEVEFIHPSNVNAVYYVEDITQYDLDNEDIGDILMESAYVTYYSCCGGELDTDIMICNNCGEHC
jgi:hypothetical protein